MIQAAQLIEEIESNLEKLKAMVLNQETPEMEEEDANPMGKMDMKKATWIARMKSDMMGE